MPDFTPGKWEAAGTGSVFVINHEEKTFQTVCNCEFGEITEEHIDEIKANARLISAAPEMHELLKIWTQIQAQPTLRNAQEDSRKLLARIDGKED